MLNVNVNGIDDEVKELVSKIVGVATDKLDPDASFVNDLNLDSLRALEVLAAIENKYNITIDPERLADMSTLNNVLKITKEFLLLK